MTDSDNKHIISILIANEPGALSSVAGLFTARSYNIISLTVGETEDPLLSRMTIAVLCADNLVKQMVHQLNKLVNIILVEDLSLVKHIERETLLAKIECTTQERIDHLQSIVKEYGVNLVEHEYNICLLELTSSSEDIESFIHVLNDWKIIEIARSGVISLGSVSQTN